MRMFNLPDEVGCQLSAHSSQLTDRYRVVILRNGKAVSSQPLALSWMIEIGWLSSGMERLSAISSQLVAQFVLTMFRFKTQNQVIESRQLTANS